MIRYENRHFWRETKDGGTMDFAGAGPQQAVTAVLATGTVVIRAYSVDDDGGVSEPFLVGVAQAGETPVRVRHGSGLVLTFHFAKGVECWVYDDREDHQAQAPVGVSFTVFEMPGHIFNDPVQVLIHRDEVRKRLQQQVDRANPKPDLVGQMQQQLDRMAKKLEELGHKDDAENPDAEAQQSAED